ncbi:MAG: Nramp family divalent metal transporter [Marinoscillum sp.]
MTLLSFNLGSINLGVILNLFQICVYNFYKVGLIKVNRFFKSFGPGLLVAATGVGAGDLATSALAGAEIGVVAIWAVIFGGVIKYWLNLGLVRWQIDTGTTLIEGAMHYYGRVAQYAFLVYLMLWGFLVAVALMSASGIALHAILPIFEDAGRAKIVFGIVLSLVGVVMVRYGGYQQFEKIMSIAVLLMVITVTYTFFGLDSSTSTQMSDLMVLPRAEDWAWFIAVLGGVGGTVTVLCYGYWIKEHQRSGESGMKTSRIDLGVSYSITVLLGVGMVVIGSNIRVTGGGAGLLVNLSKLLEEESGEIAGWVFKIGAFAAIFSSLLGVWQSVPYLFANLVNQIKTKENPSVIDTGSNVYRRSLYALSIVPMLGVPIGFARMQQLYALCGALFIPLLAVTLIILGLSGYVGHKPRKVAIVLNGFILLFSLYLVVKLAF